MTKTIILERIKDNRVHKTTLTENVSLHCDIIEKLYYKLLDRGILIDIDSLFDMYRDKY